MTLIKYQKKKSLETHLNLQEPPPQNPSVLRPISEKVFYSAQLPRTQLTLKKNFSQLLFKKNAAQKFANETKVPFGSAR